MNILIIEDHTLVHDMLAAACRQLFPSAGLHITGDGKRGVALSREVKPDLIFLDLVLPDCDGIDLVPELLSGSPAAKVIALTSFADEFTVHRVLQAKIHGFIAKNEQPLGLLKEAIDSVLAGGRYFSPVVDRIKAALRADPSSFDKVLSEHEQRLLTLFGQGLDNEAVATRVGLSANTVKVHRRNILGKLNLHSTPELMHYALEKGFTRIGTRNGTSR
jgi:DNA-binding NarL/FixJ family response regulator